MNMAAYYRLSLQAWPSLYYSIEKAMLQVMNHFSRIDHDTRVGVYNIM